jgi:hypothetical protein
MRPSSAATPGEPRRVDIGATSRQLSADGLYSNTLSTAAKWTFFRWVRTGG